MPPDESGAGDEEQQDVTVYAVPALAHASAGASLGTLISTRLLIHWSTIAIEAEREALQIRERLEAEATRRTPAGIDQTPELRAALVAVAASAHALDALYGEVGEKALGHEQFWKWRKSRGPARWKKVHEALKHGFVVPARWQKELEELFDSRDAAVHPETLTRPPVEDAGLGHHTAPEFARFSAASATRAVDLLDEILDTCTTKPKPRLQGWADSTRPSYEQLLKLRPG